MIAVAGHGTPASRSLELWRQRALRVVAMLLVGLTAVIGGVAGSSSADAYANTASSGRVGAIRWGYTGGSIVAVPGFGFRTPSMIVSRNGAIAAGYQQEVTVRYDLQWHNGRSWVTVGGTTVPTLAGVGATGVAVIDPRTLVPAVARIGHYRVATTVSWGVASALPYRTGRYTGHQQFVPSVLGDMRCGHSRCRAHAASAYVTG